MKGKIEILVSGLRFLPLLLLLWELVYRRFSLLKLISEQSDKSSSSCNSYNKSDIHPLLLRSQPSRIQNLSLSNTQCLLSSSPPRLMHAAGCGSTVVSTKAHTPVLVGTAPPQ